jgi:hypothetical protein
MLYICIVYILFRDPVSRGDRLNFQWSYHLGSEQINIFSYSLMQQSIDRHYIPILNVFLLSLPDPGRASVFEASTPN